MDLTFAFKSINKKEQQYVVLYSIDTTYAQIDFNVKKISTEAKFSKFCFFHKILMFTECWLHYNRLRKDLELTFIPIVGDVEVTAKHNGIDVALLTVNSRTYI